MILLEPAVAHVILSPRASRIRDEQARAGVLRRITAALRARGFAEIVAIEAGTTEEVRAASRAAVSAGSTFVIVAGGDGTIRDAAGALAGTGVTVGLVPCGTGNLYAAAVRVPRALAGAADLIETGVARPFDLGEVRRDDGPPEPFLVACGTGLDARLIADTSPEMKRRLGVAAYFLAATRLIPHLGPHPTILTVDGERTELEAAVVLIANCGEAIPGLLRPRLPIDPADGLLHVFVLHGGNVVRGLRGALELMTAQREGRTASGAAIRLAGRHVSIAVTPPQPTQTDGDAYPPAALDARVRPGGLLVLAPPA